MQHIQMGAVRSHLNARHMAIHLRDGKYKVSDLKSNEAHVYGDLESAYVRGLQIASRRDAVNEIARRR